MFTPSDVISGSSSTCEFIFRWWPTVGVESNAQARMQRSPARRKQLTAACREVIAVLSKHESTLEHLHKKTIQRSGLLFHCIVRVRTGRLRCWCAVLLLQNDARKTVRMQRGHARTCTQDHAHARPRACKTVRTHDRAHERKTVRSWWYMTHS